MEGVGGGDYPLPVVEGKNKMPSVNRVNSQSL